MVLAISIWTYIICCWWIKVNIGRWSDKKLPSDGNIVGENKVLRFKGSGENYALGFWGYDNGAMWC
jgi:hypothetical protein